MRVQRSIERRGGLLYTYEKKFIVSDSELSPAYAKNQGVVPAGRESKYLTLKSPDVSLERLKNRREGKAQPMSSQCCTLHDSRTTYIKDRTPRALNPIYNCEPPLLYPTGHLADSKRTLSLLPERISTPSASDCSDNLSCTGSEAGLSESAGETL